MCLLESAGGAVLAWPEFIDILFISVLQTILAVLVDTHAFLDSYALHSLIAFNYRASYGV